MSRKSNADLKKLMQKRAASKQPYKITLSAKDEFMLLHYCAANKTTPKVAIKRILRTYLTETLEPLPESAANQLDLFAPKQMNIFDVNA